MDCGTGRLAGFATVVLAAAGCAAPPRGRAPVTASAGFVPLAADPLPAAAEPAGSTIALRDLFRFPGLPLLDGGAAASAPAADADGDLAKKLANPIASLISVPFQYNRDRGIGPGEDGTRETLNIQPVVPISLDADWNLISRTIVPLVRVEDVGPGVDDESGFGDVVQSFFFSPVKPTAGGWIWGAGPVLLLPTGDSPALSADQWGVGPTAVALRQDGPWTVGLLANHIATAGGSDRLDDVNATFVQPFLAWVAPSKTTVSLNTESTYDWRERQWTVPVHLQVSQLLRIGRLPVSVGVGGRWWAEGPDGGPEGWGVRVVFTLLFPR